MTELAISCTDAHVNYSVKSNRQLIRSVIRGQKPEIRVIEAVKGVTFKVNVGESVGLIGPNGSGKTTILRTISGIMYPQKVSVTFDGQAIQKREPADIVSRGISHVPEGREIFPLLTVKENIIKKNKETF